jgi:hypothetical protein
LFRRSSRSIAPPARLADFEFYKPQSNVCTSQSSFFSPGSTKGTRYPLANYVSYHRYTPTHSSYVSSLTTLCIKEKAKKLHKRKILFNSTYSNNNCGIINYMHHYRFF